jgi:hypothetical protein
LSSIGRYWASARIGSSCSWLDRISPVAGLPGSAATCRIATSPGFSFVPLRVVNSRERVLISVRFSTWRHATRPARCATSSSGRFAFSRVRT